MSDKPEPQTDDFGRTPLHGAKTMHDVNFGLKAGCDVNAQDNNGWTALHFAAQDNRDDVLALLLANGADPNIVDRHGNGPLWTATMNARGDFRCVRRLLAAGALADHVNAHGRSPAIMASTIGHGLEDVFAAAGS